MYQTNLHLSIVVFKNDTLAVNYIPQASSLAVSRIILSRKLYHVLHTLRTEGILNTFAHRTTI